MNEYTDPKVQSGRNRGGCLVLSIALIIIVGVLMWYVMWGRAIPKTDGPALPATKGKEVTLLFSAEVPPMTPKVS